MGIHQMTSGFIHSISELYAPATDWNDAPIPASLDGDDDDDSSDYITLAM